MIRTLSGTSVCLLLFAKALEFKIVHLLLLHDHWSIVFVVDFWVAQLMRIPEDCSQRGRSNERVIVTHDACAISNMSDGFALLKSAYGQSGRNQARIASLEPTKYQASFGESTPASISCVQGPATSY